jgi:hypothetical protein
MSAWTTRQKVLFAVAFAFGLIVVRLLGDQFVRPLPIWLKLVIAAACVCVIAALALYSRRRARRLSAHR